ncbi:MAG TPA: hypothetical protein VIJ00_01920, partial [Nakamurella sp.]
TMGFGKVSRGVCEVRMSWSPCAVVGSRGYRWWTTPTRLLICVPAAWFASHNGPGGVRAAENC